MRNVWTLSLLAAGSVWVYCNLAAATIVSRDQIIEEANKVADAQLKALSGDPSIDWTWGVMDVGYADFSHVSGKGEEYQKALVAMAEFAKWTLLKHEKPPYDADDFCFGQTILDLYVTHPDPATLAPLKERCDAVADHLNAAQPQAKLTYYWCDALFMAPPTLARLSAITRDPKYINAMDKEFWRTTALLYDPAEHLFFRDAKFLNRRDPNGKKIFWARGNGWVMGGLAHILQYMPADYSSRSRYEALFKEMSAKLITLQQPDGTWHASLEDADQFKGAETSGTSLMTYGLAWGINNKLLDKKTFVPVVARAWSAMLAARRPDGLPGYSQAPGASPAAAKIIGTQVYTTGGYLLAATQLSKLAPIDIPPAPTLQSAAPVDPVPVNPAP